MKGMPQGISFFGRLYDEVGLLGVVRAYEQAAGWHGRNLDFEKVKNAPE